MWPPEPQAQKSGSGVKEIWQKEGSGVCERNRDSILRGKEQMSALSLQKNPIFSTFLALFFITCELMVLLSRV